MRKVINFKLFTAAVCLLYEKYKDTNFKRKISHFFPLLLAQQNFMRIGTY